DSNAVRDRHSTRVFLTLRVPVSRSSCPTRCVRECAPLRGAELGHFGFHRWHERRPSGPAASRALFPGIDPGTAALLGRLRLRDPPALRHGGRCRHVSSSDDVASARAKTLERGLCAALTSAEGWPLWGKSQPTAALLPVPGDLEALAGGHPGTLSQIALRDRH